LGRLALRVRLLARRWLRALQEELLTPLPERLAFEFLELRQSFDSLPCI